MFIIWALLTLALSEPLGRLINGLAMFVYRFTVASFGGIVGTVMGSLVGVMTLFILAYAFGIVLTALHMLTARVFYGVPVGKQEFLSQTQVNCTMYVVALAMCAHAGFTTHDATRQAFSLPAHLNSWAYPIALAIFTNMQDSINLRCTPPQSGEPAAPEQ